MYTLQTSAPARLHHLHQTSENPERLAEFYVRMLNMTQQQLDENTVLLSGGQRNMVISRGPNQGLSGLSYALKDAQSLAVLRAHLVGAIGSVAECSSPFFERGAFSIQDPQDRIVMFGVPLAEALPDQLPARLQHVVFQTTKLEEVVDFYSKIVGFVISDDVVDDDNQIMTCFLRSDNEHHSLAFFRGSNNELDHYCYETSSWNDIRDWGDRFAKQRIPIFFGPGRHGPGDNLFFMVTDPDGNRLEFSAELQTVAADTLPGVWPHSEYTLNSWGRAWIRT